MRLKHKDLLFLGFIVVFGVSLWPGFQSMRLAMAQDWERARQEGFEPERSSLLEPTGSAPSVQRGSARADGRITARSYLSGDDSETYQTPLVSISFLETDLRARDLTRDGLQLDLDATFIIDVSQANERRFGETERFDQVRQLVLTQPLGQTQLSVGRRLISQAGNAWVDGLDLMLKFDRKRSYVGLYGGFLVILESLIRKKTRYNETNHISPIHHFLFIKSKF